MTPSKYTLDEQLRRYALGNLRATLTRLKDGDRSTAPATTAEASWRELYLNKAAKWAQIAEALRPEPSTCHPADFGPG